jgi:beta-galactosidase/beta-glucuronidase
LHTGWPYPDDAFHTVEQPQDRAVFANPTLPGPSDPVRWMKTSLQSLDEMIDAGFNSPSIILWAFFNEAR